MIFRQMVDAYMEVSFLIYKSSIFMGLFPSFHDPFWGTPQF